MSSCCVASSTSTSTASEIDARHEASPNRDVFIQCFSAVFFLAVNNTNKMKHKCISVNIAIVYLE